MADFTALKTAIQNAIKQNGNEEITGNLLQDVLLAIVTTLGEGNINNLINSLDAEAQARQLADSTLQGGINTVSAAITAINNAIGNGCVYAGIATPSSTPASGRVFYLALAAGTYTNYGGLEVSHGINILKNNGSTWSLDSFLGIDDAPTPSSNNLVKSGGVFNDIMTNGSAFDLTAYNNGTTYADLNAALTALNALPADYKKGGMSFKFVQTSDNKYVQYRLMKNEWSTMESDWQGVDEEVLDDSSNLVESKAVFNQVNQVKRGLSNTIEPSLIKEGYVNNPDGKYKPRANANTAIYNIKGLNKIWLFANSDASQTANHYAFWNDIEGKNVIGETFYFFQLGITELSVPANANYLGVCYSFDNNKPITTIALGKDILAFAEFVKDDIIDRLNILNVEKNISYIGYVVNYQTGKLGYSGRNNDKCAVFNVEGKEGLFIKVSDDIQLDAKFYAFWSDIEGQNVIGSTYYVFNTGLIYIEVPAGAKYFAINYSYYTSGSGSLDKIKVLFQNEGTVLSRLQDFTMRSNLVWSAIGDSLTELNNNTNAQQQGWCKKGYMSRVCQKIKNISYINNGHSGETISDTEDRSYIAADIYTIFFGQNDWNQGKVLGNKSNFDAAQYDGTVMGSLGALIAKIRQVSTSPILVLSPVESGVACMRTIDVASVPSDTPNGQGWTIADMAKMEADCLEGNSLGVKFVDMHKLSGFSKRNTNYGAYVMIGGNLQKVIYPDYLNYISFGTSLGNTLFQNDCNYMTYDGCHPSDLGCQAIADSLIPYMEEALNIGW